MPPSNSEGWLSSFKRYGVRTLFAKVQFRCLLLSCLVSCRLSNHCFRVLPLLPPFGGLSWGMPFLIERRTSNIILNLCVRLPNGLRYLRWGRDGEAVQLEK